MPAWIVGAALCAMLIVGCAGEEARESQIYIVRPQDTLYSIAWRHNLDYRDLAQWNRIGPDFRIVVGQRLVLAPPFDAMPRPSGAQQAPGVSPPPSGAQSASGMSSTLRSPREEPRSGRPAIGGPIKPAAIAAATAHINWVWPTDRGHTARSVESGGILFPGRFGQDVRAAASGRVVYTGGGIRGYGQLVIIKHNDMLLSAYAYNREVLVHEGQEIAAGDLIARMGEGSHQSAALYFEIRYNGKPIDALPLLSSAR